MDEEPTEELLQLSEKLLSALEDIGVLGEWSFDYATQLFRSSPGISRAFNVDPMRGEKGEPVEVYERAIHRGDVDWLRSTRSVAPGWSGLRVTEMRVVDGEGQERWIMVRGRFLLDVDDSPVSGHGVMLDLTDYHASGDQPMIAPNAPIPAPLFVLGAALTLAFRAAKQATLDAVQAACGELMVQVAQLLARKYPGIAEHLKSRSLEPRRLH